MIDRAPWPRGALMRTPEQIAEDVRAAGVPDILNRWLPGAAERFERARARVLAVPAHQTKEEPMKAPAEGSKEADVKRLRLLRDRTAAAAPGTKTAAATAPAQPKETTPMATKTTAAKPAKPKPAAKAAKASPAARHAKTAPKAAARSAARSAGTVRPGSKLEIVVNLLKRPEGCTSKDVLKATGWPAVSMPQQAKAAGLTLKKEKGETGVTIYRA